MSFRANNGLPCATSSPLVEPPGAPPEAEIPTTPTRKTAVTTSTNSLVHDLSRITLNSQPAAPTTPAKRSPALRRIIALERLTPPPHTQLPHMAQVRLIQARQRALTLGGRARSRSPSPEKAPKSSPGPRSYRDARVYDVRPRVFNSGNQDNEENAQDKSDDRGEFSPRKLAGKAFFWKDS